MRISIQLSLCLVFILSVASCEKSDTDTTQMIFGSFCGECSGEQCVVIYKLTDEGVWEDKNDIYPGTQSNGANYNFEELSDEKFELVKEFINQFPENILDETVNTFGCPDCYDQCGYYLEWKEDGVTNSWTIDTVKDDVPAYLHEFMDQLVANIILLKE